MNKIMIAAWVVVISVGTGATLYNGSVVACTADGGPFKGCTATGGCVSCSAGTGANNAFIVACTAAGGSIITGTDPSDVCLTY
ncbi:MAG: hypothetical protein ACJ763_13420 [Bdellovibrionia bacterium]